MGPNGLLDHRGSKVGLLRRIMITATRAAINPSSIVVRFVNTMLQSSCHTASIVVGPLTTADA